MLPSCTAGEISTHAIENYTLPVVPDLTYSRLEYNKYAFLACHLSPITMGLFPFNNMNFLRMAHAEIEASED